MHIKTPNKPVSRRVLLFTLGGAELVALVSQFSNALFGYFKPRIQPGSFGGKVVAGKPLEFKKGTVSHVQEGHFYVSRLADGGYLALWQRCTHLGCTVPWRKDLNQFVCPCHSSIFNPQGEVVGGPAPRAMDMFPIELTAGQLVVDTGNPIARERFDPAQVFHT